MNTSTFKQSKPGILNPPEVQQGPIDQSPTIDVVQSLQNKLRDTRENLERLRIDPSAEDSGPAKPHALTETIANQLRLVNQERQHLMDQLGVGSGENLPEAIMRMQQELEQLRQQNNQPDAVSDEKPELTHFSGDSGAPERLRAAHPETVLQQSLREKAAARAQNLQQSEPEPATPVQEIPPVIEQPVETQEEAEEMMESAPEPVDLKNEVQPAVELNQLLAQLNVNDLTSARIEVEQMKSLLDETGNNPKVRELTRQNQELAVQLKKMNAEQQAICKRFKVNNLTELARLILHKLSQKNEVAAQQAKSAEATEVTGSWAAIANMLQGWDESLNHGDPNRSVKIQRSDEGWVVSTNWKDQADKKAS